MPFDILVNESEETKRMSLGLIKTSIDCCDCSEYSHEMDERFAKL